MTETSGPNRDGVNSHMADGGIGTSGLKAWFVREVLSLEAVLTQFLRHNWRDQSDIEDLLHDVYARVYDAARRQLPDNPKAFVFTVARNLLSNRIRERAVIPIEAVSDWHYETLYKRPRVNQTRSRTVVVPNVGAMAGFSIRFPNAKVSMGYRADVFFGAMDVGWDARKTEDRSFYGPFATISIGLGG